MKIHISKLKYGDLVLKDITIKDANATSLKEFLELFQNSVVVDNNLTESDVSENQVEVEVTPILLDDILNEIEVSELSDYTKRSYKSILNKISDHFKESNFTKLVNDRVEDVISYVESVSESASTRKNYYSALLKVIKLFELKNLEKFQEKFDECRILKDVQHHQKAEVKPLAEADNMMENLKEKSKKLKHKLTNEWDQSKQLYCLSLIYLHYGVIRPNELKDLVILEDTDDEINHINISKKCIVLYNHKTAKKDGKRVIKLNDDILEILKDGVGCLFFPNKDGSAYSDSSGIGKIIKSKFGFLPYEFRKANTSKVISSGDVEKIKETASNQGHKFETQLKHYSTYK